MSVHLQLQVPMCSGPREWRVRLQDFDDWEIVPSFGCCSPVEFLGAEILGPKPNCQEQLSISTWSPTWQPRV